MGNCQLVAYLKPLSLGTRASVCLLFVLLCNRAYLCSQSCGSINSSLFPVHVGNDEYEHCVEIQGFRADEPGKIESRVKVTSKTGNRIIALRFGCVGVKVQYPQRRAIKIRFHNQHFLPGQYSEERTVRTQIQPLA